MRFTILGSGSEGNCLLIEAPCDPAVQGAFSLPITHSSDQEAAHSRLLIDCGFGLRVVEQKLQERGVSAASLNGIVVTHEHGDHIGGVFRLARKHQIPVYLTRGTLRACRTQVPDAVQCILIDSHQEFNVGSLFVRPFAVPHDAFEPIGCVVHTQDHSLALLTDLGRSTPAVQRAIAGVDALILECNHDADLLQQGPYPPSLKRRVGGDWGHLSNSQAAEILYAHERSGLRTVIAAHLSQTNNTPELAMQTLRSVVGEATGGVQALVADQFSGLNWQQL